MADWGTASAWTTHTISLASLASGSSVTASTSIDNTTSKDLFLEVELILGSITPSTSPYMEIHLLPLLSDGTTYADYGTNTRWGTLPLTTGTSVKSGSISIPNSQLIGPGTYRLAILNGSGTSLAATGNTLKSRLIPLA